MTIASNCQQGEEMKIFKISQSSLMSKQFLCICTDTCFTSGVFHLQKSKVKQGLCCWLWRPFRLHFSRLALHECGLTSISSVSSTTFCCSCITHLRYTSATKKKTPKRASLQQRAGKIEGFFFEKTRSGQSAAICTSHRESEKFMLMSCGANAVSIGKDSPRWIKVDFMSSAV